jgi:AhpD family alkylhydroperoxidase
MRTSFKHKFGLIHEYEAFVLVCRAMFHLIQNSITPIIDMHFIERLMLATTEVNGCDACSYAHTQMALKSGFSKEEIDALLSGDKAFVVQEEAKAILFAQHYASSMGHPEGNLPKITNSDPRQRN